MEPRFAPKPEWLRVRAPGGDRYHELKKTLRDNDLYTVCEEARCPNVGECWREGTMTVMLLGDVCTRGCRFCAVTTGDPRGAVDTREPEHVARAIAKVGLNYVVLTMVNRDDLLDGGADHVARTVTRLRELRGDMLIETLVGDFRGQADAIAACADGNPDVFAHNVETVRRLTRTVRDVRSSYDQSLRVLEQAATIARSFDADAARRPMLTKSSIMVGLGETDDEVLETLRDLRRAGVAIVTLGQYLRPSPKHHEVLRFVPPDTFAMYEREALSMGFLYCAAGPLVRSSYKAAEVFLRSLAGDPTADVAAALEDRIAAARRAAERVRDEHPKGDLVPAASLVRRA
ncbi:MAG: lipoyl synthase [Polyangiaceae bacterium]